MLRSLAPSPARRTRPAPATSTSSTATSTSGARTSSTPTTTLGCSPPWLVQRLDDLGERRRRAARDHRQPGARALRRPRRRPRRAARGCATSPRRACGSPTALCNWSIVAFPNEGWANDRLRRARRRAALGRGRDRRSARRARPGRGLAGPHREPRAARGRAQRAPLRRAPLPRPRHRPDGRAPSGLDLAGGARRVDRDRARREHADRGGLHRPRRPARRRHRPLDLSAPDPGHDRPRARGSLRGRPRRRGARRRGRGADEHARRSPTTARPGSARSRSSTATRASARPGSSSTTRSSTRTPRRTSRSATAILQAVDGAARALARGTPRARRQPLVDPHRLHDRLARARDLRRDERRRRGRRSCGTATGS